MCFTSLSLPGGAVKATREASADELDRTEKSDSLALHLCVVLLIDSCCHSILEDKATMPGSDFG